MRILQLHSFCFLVSLFFLLQRSLTIVRTCSAYQESAKQLPTLIWWDHLYTSQYVSQLFLISTSSLQSFNSFSSFTFMILSSPAMQEVVDQSQGRYGRRPQAGMQASRMSYRVQMKRPRQRRRWRRQRRCWCNSGRAGPGGGINFLNNNYFDLKFNYLNIAPGSIQTLFRQYSE